MNDHQTVRLEKKESERHVAELVKDILASQLAGYDVNSGKSLLYKIEVDGVGQLSHDHVASPIRGKYAFQTDILIAKDEVPLVVIELKSGSFSSHDVITYSWKAERHKRIYPYLRYGFVVVGLESLGRRFLTHNEAFDFAMALPNSAAIETDLVALARRQILSAERLIALMRPNRVKLRRYEETVEIEESY
jgi:hypothetical protein